MWGMFLWARESCIVLGTTSDRVPYAPSSGTWGTRPGFPRRHTSTFSYPLWKIRHHADEVWNPSIGTDGQEVKVIIMNNSYEVKYSSAFVIKSFSIKNVMVCRPKTLIGKIEWGINRAFGQRHGNPQGNASKTRDIWGLDSSVLSIDVG